MTDDAFGVELERLMKQRGLGVRELARQMESSGINPSGATISQLKKGYISPSTRLMEAVAVALEVPPEHFAEYRLETVRERLEWRPPTSAAASARGRYLRRALAAARELGLDL